MSDIRTDSRQKLEAVTGAHHLAATRRDAAIHQKPIEGDALITQRVALVDADDRRRQALDILACGEANYAVRIGQLRLLKRLLPCESRRSA